MTGPDVSVWETVEPSVTPAALTAVRADRRKRAVALALALAVGLAAAWVHWLGLVAAGALVGLASRSLPRAVVWGVVVGLLAVALTVVAHSMAAGDLVSLRPPAYVTVAVGLLAPVWGSLVRAVV